MATNLARMTLYLDRDGSGGQLIHDRDKNIVGVFANLLRSELKLFGLEGLVQGVDIPVTVTIEVDVPCKKPST